MQYNRRKMYYGNDVSVNLSPEVIVIDINNSQVLHITESHEQTTHNGKIFSEPRCLLDTNHP